MGIEGGLFTDLVVIFAVAAGGGLAARLLRLPALLGYIALGILIGPDVLEFSSELLSPLEDLSIDTRLRWVEESGEDLAA